MATPSNAVPLWNWKQFAISQRNPATGCIPTGYEMLLRAANIQGIDYGTFQEDFDQGQGGNCFGSVAEAIQARYLFVRIAIQEFSTGAEKLAFIEETAPNKLLLASIAHRCGGWHIMPIVDMTDNAIVLLSMTSGYPQLRSLAKAELVDLHDTFWGGKDVSYLS